MSDLEEEMTYPYSGTAGAITEADAKFVETWENIAPITNYIIRLDIRGDERQEGIQGKRTFYITTQERLITQDRIVDKKHDPFLNGSFRPVVVPDSVNTQTNPNALSDDEIRSILVSSELAWDEWMKTIDSGETLRRMIDIASETDVSLKRYKHLEQRLAQVNPPKRIVQKDQEEYDKMSGTATPSSRTRPRVGS